MTRSRASIVAAIVIDNGRVLMVRRRVAEGRLSWQFPAGEMEQGEMPFDTASRETLEEVGLVVRPVSTLGERDHPMTGRHMIYVGCAVEHGSTASLVDIEDLDKVEWCTWSLLTTHVPDGLYPPVRQYLIEALAM